MTLSSPPLTSSQVVHRARAFQVLVKGKLEIIEIPWWAYSRGSSQDIDRARSYLRMSKDF
jgi:hypothetical protein